MGDADDPVGLGQVDAARWICLSKSVTTTHIDHENSYLEHAVDWGASIPLITRLQVKLFPQSVARSVIWGPPKSGKSFWTFDVIMRVAAEPCRQIATIKPGSPE